MSHHPTPQSPRRPRSGRPPSVGMMWSLTLAAATIIGAPLCFLVWGLFQVWGNDEVVSSESIGAFIQMSPFANWSGSVVIQTDQGFLPLHKAVAIQTGTPLILELRTTGRRYVCDRGRALCVETSKEGFSREAAGGRP